MSKVVLDTNVVVAAFVTRGLCDIVFELCMQQHEMIVSDFLLEELKNKLTKKFKVSPIVVGEFLQLYCNNSTKVVPTILESHNCRDANDVAVIGTCVSGRADFLVTGDKDLLVLKRCGETIFLSPREFYELYSMK